MISGNLKTNEAKKLFGIKITSYSNLKNIEFGK